MKIGFALKCLAATIATIGSVAAHAAILWDEDANGDLSSNGLEPTSLVASVGSNRVLGTTGDSGQGVDRDYFTFTVPGNAVLSSIMLLDETQVSGSVSFIAIQGGSQLTVTPSGMGAALLLAVGHYGNDQRGTDLLPAITVGAIGPFTSGSYSVWVQETGGPSTYGFDFVITQVPEPSDWALMLLGLPLVLMARRRTGSPTPRFAAA